AFKVLLAGAVLLVLLVLGWRLLQRFLWKVGRRLAFSYFLMGVLPIPMVLLLLLAGAYILAGSFMGHLFRHVTRGLRGGLQARAEAEVQDFASTGRPPAPGSAGAPPEVVFGYYRNGRRIAGDPRTPALWPGFLSPDAADPGNAGREALPPFLALPDGAPTL